MAQAPRKPQQKQDKSAPFSAGRNAYKLLIPINNNPYHTEPARDLWDKGFRIERRKDDVKRNGNRPPKKVEQPVVEKPRHRRPEAKKPEPPRPVISERLVNRFNKRHQTRA